MARRVIVSTIAADTACQESDHDGDGITVVEWRERPGRRHFDVPAKAFQAVTMGHGLVVSCHRDWLEWSRDHVRSLDRVQFHTPGSIAAIVAMLAGEGHTLLGPQTSLACSADTFRAAGTPTGVTLDTYHGPMVEALRAPGTFPNALAARPNRARPDVLAVTATAGGAIVACAGASADSPEMWQIGVDVLAPWRSRGVGRAVVSRLTEAILESGKVPYYSHTISNVPSAALAASLGFWPGWVQWYAREQR